MKILFPRPSKGMEGILVNTSGGLTGGDQLSLQIRQETQTQFSQTTQAAERVYRAYDGFASMHTQVTVAAKATHHWLPQELILFEGASLRRNFHADLASDAKFLMVEPIVFGRQFMGETLHQVTFRDHISIDRDGRPLYRDVIDLSNAVGDRLSARAGGGQCGAMATLCYIAPDAEVYVPLSRKIFGRNGGASLLDTGLLVARLIAPDSLTLRHMLMDLLIPMTGDAVPKSWRL